MSAVADPPPLSVQGQINVSMILQLTLVIAGVLDLNFLHDIVEFVLAVESLTLSSLNLQLSSSSTTRRESLLQFLTCSE